MHTRTLLGLYFWGRYILEFCGGLWSGKLKCFVLVRFFTSYPVHHYYHTQKLSERIVWKLWLHFLAIAKFHQLTTPPRDPRHWFLDIPLVLRMFLSVLDISTIWFKRPFGFMVHIQNHSVKIIFNHLSRNLDTKYLFQLGCLWGSCRPEVSCYFRRSDPSV